MPSAKEYVARDGTRTWRVRLRLGGRKGTNTTETFTTKRAAEQFCKLVDAIGAAAAIADRDRKDSASRDYMPKLREWLPEHIEHLTGVTDRTRIDYQRLADRTFLPILGELPLDLIDRHAVAKFINAMDAKGLSAKSIANAQGLLSATLAAAVIAEHIPSNPAHRMRLPRSREQERRDERFLTHEEYHRLVAAVDVAYRPMVVTMFGTGLRWSELTALQVRDVILGRPPTIRVNKAWKWTPGQPMQVGPPKSKKSRRTVMLPQQVVDAIGPLLERDGDALLFAAPHGGPIYHGWWRTRVWVPACIRAGLATPRPDAGKDPKGHKAWHFDGPRIHDARHTHASWLMEQGATLEMVQDQPGHESILTTRKVYGHLQPAMRASIAEAATRALAMGEVREIEGG